ncbi:MULTISPECIES: DMT family transporter [Bacillaceae]|uniref:DMT family transporter n=1 Tax=Evansella alkalicola TaxID=745819 RepID=A0ABS6JWP3_9BACI|nr:MULTISPECIES: DMT family transporter [Bacillaceae]MBU9723011.1 DMT family transporter [Bacillus alkalicola]
MVLGIILAAVAGAFVSIQTVFNNKVNEKTGSWLTTSLVLSMGFIFALVASILMGEFNASQLLQMESWYWLGGVTGVGVVFCLVQAIRRLGPTYSIAIVLTAQLGTALIWDSLGLLGLEKIPFSFNKLVGIIIIIGGVIVFKYKSGYVDEKST